MSRRKLRFLRALGKKDTREIRGKRWTVVIQAGGELEKIQPRGAVSTGKATRWDPEHHSRLPGVASYLPVTVGLGERKQELWSKWSKNGGGRR